MRNQFDKELEKLNDQMIEMGMLVEKAIESAFTALVSRDKEQAKMAIKFDDEVDHKEKEIEHLCLKLLLKQQPVAKDLRIISAALKMITDMERIGDQAADISEISIFLAESGTIKNLTHIKQMAEETKDMVNKSIDAFVKNNVELAREVTKQDDIVDELFTVTKSDLIELIRNDVEKSELATDFLMVAKYFERIGDHATNIAEWVIFSITGDHEKLN